MNLSRRLVAIGSLALLGMLGCDSPADPDDAKPLSAAPFVVSSPVPDLAPSGVQPAGTMSRASFTSSSIYVSLPPGSIPNGVGATILNRRTGLTVSIPMTSGGFDPVPLAAAVGDTIAVSVQASGTGPKTYTFLVPLRARPTVIRTSPPPNKRDVPLNSIIQVVFSEPMDSASLITAIQLLQNLSSVPGTVVLPDVGDILVATFVPASPLEILTNYVLDVGTQAQDHEGNSLSSPVQSDFTTGGLPADTTGPSVAFVDWSFSPVQPAGFPRFRVIISEPGGIDVLFRLQNEAGGAPIEEGWGTDGSWYFKGDLMMNLWNDIPPGRYTAQVMVTDVAGDITDSASVALTVVTPDTMPRIVVRSFEVLELHDSAADNWYYVPRMVVADAAGQSGLDIVGFEILDIPGLSSLSPFATKRFARSLPVEAGLDIPLFSEYYGDYDFMTYGLGAERSTGGQVTARLTYRDRSGHYYAATTQGLIVPGSPPPYTGGCNHWATSGSWPGDMSYCGFTGD